MPLSELIVRNAKPTAKTQRLSDGRGLYLEVAPSGGRWWRFKYRFQGKEKKLSLGVYPDVSLKDARQKRETSRQLVASGVDPSAVRKAEKASIYGRAGNSLEVVTREWFAKQERGWAKSHSIRVIRLFERDIFPWIGGRPVADITPPELLEVIRRIEARAVETAHRALNNCGMVFRYAIATGRCIRDPAADLRGALAPSQKGHFAATTDLEQLAGILRMMDGYRGSPAVCAALRLAPLVFVRPGELRSAEWSHVDLAKAEWRFVASKSRGGEKKDHIVPLARQAVAILEELRVVTGRKRYVFTCSRMAQRPMSDNAVLAAMRRLGIEKHEMTGHGLRAVARTLMDEELEVRPDFIEQQLAHAVRDPNGRAYNRTKYLRERKTMMQAWADYLDKLKAP